MTSTSAEVRLIQLRSCLANLPSQLVNALGNANAIVQDVIVELRVKDNAHQASTARGPSHKSLFAGWTGMSSAQHPSKDCNPPRRKPDAISYVEIDEAFGHTLGLTNGQMVEIKLHLDPPLAHTINVEPLTPADWEIIELHASFLESNLLFQVRALPNPTYIASPGQPEKHSHPITVHLSPTSTANVAVTAVSPTPSPNIAFAKIAPDCEVIVTPKTRSRLRQPEVSESRSIASKRSLEGQRSRQASSQNGQTSVLLRCVDQLAIPHSCDKQTVDETKAHALAVFVDRDLLRHSVLKRSDWVTVAVVQPPVLQPASNVAQQQKIQEAKASGAGLPAKRVVARLRAWENGPDQQHAALSPLLSATLGLAMAVGGIVRLSWAPNPIAHGDIEGFNVFPFTTGEDDVLRLGKAKSMQEALRGELASAYGQSSRAESLLKGPITDGQLLPATKKTSWPGGIVRFIRAKSRREADPDHFEWCLGHNILKRSTMESSVPHVQLLDEMVDVSSSSWVKSPPYMVGVSNQVDHITQQLARGSSLMVTGGPGSGRTSICQLVASRLRSEDLVHTTLLSCDSLKSEETRISTVKEIFSRLFSDAIWGCKLSGRSLIVLDDLDDLCPAETELQTADNGRSRQISELLRSMWRQYAAYTSKVSILCTATSRDSLHNLIHSGGIFREIVHLKAPTKDGRRDILGALVHSGRKRELQTEAAQRSPDNALESPWMIDEPLEPTEDAVNHVGNETDIDMLDIANQTDGFLPRDLLQLVGRAKNEAMIRSMDHKEGLEALEIRTQDFRKALEGFTPASLQNVNLQSSKTTFASVGGLQHTRRVLLETLQYPTKYAPIFAQCPLRLRSGLLLYGYPGCGKTLLASAVAGECGLNFISVKGPEILNKYIGASEKSVRDLFERAESAKPCVLFFDEFDSIAPKRGHDSTGVTDRVVNQMLTQMDGAEGLTGVYVLAATSRPDLIDPALLRPGRLDKSILCDMPALEDRLDILKALAKNLTLAPSISSEKSSSRNLSEIAARTEGYTGADLQAVIYNAHLEAIHDVLGSAASVPNGQGKRTKSNHREAREPTPDILQFRFGQSPRDSHSGSNRAAEIAEYAAILAKLNELKIMRKKEREDKRSRTNDESGDRDETSQQNSSTNVIIQWKHIESSLSSTRSSISATERRRLQNIYHEFHVDRSGEMPDGQAVNEIGGRSSLM